ncbi:hypothetical protein IMZ48_15375 [Candidatus Bathyarchaeota archaeon]|nr:hypothetical protein [Candidatus Bathyarchaeota archaeon]
MSAPLQPAVLNAARDIAAAATPTAKNALDLVTAVAATATATGAPTDGDGNSGDCSLLGSFALLVQLSLGGLALLSLVFKRWKERPQRPIKIWWFDVSKQVFGSVLVHGANVFMSMLTSGRVTFQSQPIGAVSVERSLLRRVEEEYRPNPCSFYLLNLAIDVSGHCPFPPFCSHLHRAVSC